MTNKLNWVKVSPCDEYLGDYNESSRFFDVLLALRPVFTDNNLVEDYSYLWSWEEDNEMKVTEINYRLIEVLKDNSERIDNSIDKLWKDYRGENDDNIPEMMTTFWENVYAIEQAFNNNFSAKELRDDPWLQGQWW